MLEFIIGDIKPENVFIGDIRKCIKCIDKSSLTINGLGLEEQEKIEYIESDLHKKMLF